MRYFKQFKEIGATPKEIAKEDARRTLDGWWEEEALDDIFSNEKQFRLWTPVSEVWTKDEDGRTVEAGFYGFI